MFYSWSFGWPTSVSIVRSPEHPLPALLREELASSIYSKCSQQNILNRSLSFSCNNRSEQCFGSFCHDSLMTGLGSAAAAWACPVCF